VADSTSELVGDVARAAIEALGLTRPVAGGAGTEAVPVVKRKQPGVPDGDRKGLPQVVVSVGEEGETEYLTATEKLKKYPVVVLIVTNTGALAGDDPAVRWLRSRVERTLDARSTWRGTVPGFNRVTLRHLSPFERAALPKDLNYSAVVAVVEVVEQIVSAGGDDTAGEPLVWGNTALVWGS
jgi:hypothetical protein